MMVIFAHKKKEVWDELLDTCVYAYNSSVHESTAFTPFEIMFGRRAVLPIDLEIDDRSPDAVLQQQQDDSQDSITAVEHITNHRHKLSEVAKMNIERAQKNRRSSMTENMQIPLHFPLVRRY